LRCKNPRNAGKIHSSTNIKLDAKSREVNPTSTVPRPDASAKNQFSLGPQFYTLPSGGSLFGKIPENIHFSHFGNERYSATLANPSGRRRPAAVPANIGL
jgi:hypothetical protein